MDKLIENGVSEKVEEKLWNDRDNLDFDIIKKHLGKLKKDAFVIVLYSEKDFTENEIEEKDIDTYIYIGNESSEMNLDKIDIGAIGKYTENRYMIGKKIFLRENVDTIDNLDVQLFDTFYKTLSGNTDRVVRNNQTLNIGTDRYHLETSNEFLCKIPWYIINDSGDSPLLRLSVDNDGGYKYDTKIFNDDNRGNFCTTIDGNKVKYWKEYRVKLQEYKYGILGFLRNRGFENFLNVRLRELNFNDAIRNALPEEVLSLFYGKQYKSINKKDLYRIKKALTKANDQVKKFNKLIRQMKFKERYEAEYGENVIIIPNIPEFKLILYEKTNVLEKDYISPGYTVNIGFRNFKSLFVIPKFSNNFIRILRWTFIFAFLSALASFLIGFFLSIILNTTGFKGKNIYRTIFILPYAIPSSISMMVWAAMLNQDFGMINRFLNLNIPWLYDPILTKITVILVNVWLSFPFFMVVCSGALQSVDRELYDIASVDGANRFQKIFYITLPLILITIGPFLVGYVGLSFNNFTIIYLLTYQGSDIFVSWIYNLAFRGKEYGFAGAVALLSFIIIGPLMLAQLKLSGFFKDKRLN
ncbi:MAG: sugar ABC transporter permease [Spirochaetes bacterium]|nr:sugar ABC transporter permease [Spirochaetota bacterium]